METAVMMFGAAVDTTQVSSIILLSAGCKIVRRRQVDGAPLNILNTLGDFRDLEYVYSDKLYTGEGQWAGFFACSLCLWAVSFF